MSGVGDALNQFIWAGGRLVDAWPATPDDNAYATPRTSQIETLLISGEVDGATPAENATKDVLPHLPNGRQVILKGFGHTTDFWNNQKPAGAHLINAFYATGKVDDSRFTEQKIDLDAGHDPDRLGEEARRRDGRPRVRRGAVAGRSPRWRVREPRAARTRRERRAALRVGRSCSASAAGSAPRCSR